MRKVLFILMPVLAFLVAGFGGYTMRAPSGLTVTGDDQQGDIPLAPAIQHGANATAPDRGHKGEAPFENAAWLPFPHQFFIPLMKGGQVSGTMVLSVIIEMPEPALARVRDYEHRLRDALLRRLMIHANTGGFDGNFTTEPRMELLRKALLTTTREVAGDEIMDVLIEDIMRQ